MSLWNKVVTKNADWKPQVVTTFAMHENHVEAYKLEHSLISLSLPAKAHIIRNVIPKLRLNLKDYFLL